MLEVNELIKKNQYHEALRLVDRKLSIEKDNGDLLLSKANILYFTRDFENALIAVNHAINFGKKTPWTYARKGLILCKLGKFLEAVNYLKMALEMNLVHYEVYYSLATALKELERIEESKIFYKKALELNSNVIFRDWKIESDLVRDILKRRLQKWLREKDPKYKDIVTLLNKQACKVYTQNKNIYSPETYRATANFKDVYLSQFPSRVVIKPEDGADSNGVYVIENGIDLFTLEKIPNRLDNFLKEKVSAHSFTKDKRVLIEELIDDVDFKHNPYLKIPRDFKVFVAGGQVFYIGVYNRNARKELRSVVEYSVDWKRIPRMSTSYLPGCTEKKPKFFKEMISLAKEISREFPYVMRLDFYLSDKGPVFGEFTPNPSAGFNLTEVGERTLQQLFFVYPDEYSS